MARGLPNKKLLAPLGCQESSVPVNITGAVMANSIAIRKSAQFNIFPHCWKANSMELAGGSSTSGRYGSRAAYK
ncbi:MAG: hypothetical protein DMG50_09095 [Acidobacteria bacterium]|nr:MAG: hypothetical protein DMG50_09095 [Acidobacteriota bacterium]